MATVITVHGTFNSGADEGSHWWQKGSEFENDVRNYVESEDGALEFQPHVWDGKNSETSRREAGRTLADKLVKLSEEGKHCAIIGHSHGGSVIENGYLCLPKRFQTIKQSFASAITVGTPFPVGRRRAFLLFRLEPLGQVLYIWTIAMFLVGSSTQLPSIIQAPKGERLFSAMSEVLALGIIFFFVTLMYGWGNNKSLLFHLKQRKRARANPSSVYHFYHKNDEAIAGLKSLLAAPTPVIFSRDAISIILTQGVVLALCTLAALQVIGASLGALVAHGILSSTYGFTAFATDKVERGDLFGVMILFGILNWLGYRILSPYLVWPLSKGTWSQMIQKAVGGDTRGEIVTGVAPHAYWSKATAKGLPDELGDNLSYIANAAAAKSIPKLRAAIGELAFAMSNQSDSNAVAQYLTWDELIHTVYFKAPRFRKLVCYAIAHSPGFRPSEKLKADPDYEKLGQWLAEIKGEAAPTPASE